MDRPLQYRKPLMSDDTDGLKAAIEREHGGTATVIGTELVTAMWQGLIAWQGVVQVYALTNRRGAVQDGVCVVRSSGRKRAPATGAYGSESRLDQHGVGCGDAGQGIVAKNAADSARPTALPTCSFI